jgi:L-fuconolactonase
VIDSHFHVWDGALRDHSWLSAVPMLETRYDIARYEAEAQRLGIEGAILVQVLNDLDETREFLAIAGKSALVRGVVGWVDLQAPDVDDQLASLQESRYGQFLVGVRHLLEGERDPEFLERPEIERGLRAVAQRGLAFDFMGRPDQLASARRVLERCDDLRIVLDRAGKPDLSDLSAYGWDQNLRAMATTRRVAVKIAGLANEAGPQWSEHAIQPTVDFVLDVVGPSSVMFGSDWPVCLAVATFDDVVDLTRSVCVGLTPAETHEVFHESARRFYGVAA